MERDPVHLYVGLYETVADAERDFDGLKKLYAEGLSGTYDAAVVTRDAIGTPRVDKKRHSGHAVWVGAGIGAFVGVLFPAALIPMALLGAGSGALVRHAQDALPKDDAKELAEALASGEAALDVKKDDFTAALRQAREEG